MDLNFKIVTKLEQIYPKNEIDEIYEPLYEDLRSNYYKLFNTDPTSIIRVPYTITLFGDNVTKLFNDKIISNLKNDIIIISSKNKTKQLKINFFDSVKELTFPLSSFETKEKKENINLILDDYLISGYCNGLKIIEKEKQSGANILLLMNNTNLDDDDVFISSFLGMFLCSIYLNDSSLIEKGKINKTILYEKVLISLGELKSIDIQYYASYLYFKIFLKNNCIGYNIGNSYNQKELIDKDKDLNQLVFDSFSPEPMKYYSSSKYWNKRRVEVRLGLSLILKRFKEDYTIEDLIKYSSDILKFINLFGNIESVFKSMDVYLRKTKYSLNEIKSELNINIDSLLKDIKGYQGALMTKDFELYKRVYYILKEYEEVVLISHKFLTGEKIDLIEQLKLGNKNMKENYDCLSEEMISLEIELNDKYNNIAIKSISEGWSGKLIGIGNKDSIQKMEKYLFDKFEKYNQDKGDMLISAWISDDINKYVIRSEFGGCINIFDPKYEDFMLDYVKQKNNIEGKNEGNN